MDAQLSFASLEFAGKKKSTKRDVFLAEMAAVVPWSVLEGVIAPHYPRAGANGGRRAFPIAVMLRIYCLQQWYNLSDPGAEEALCDIQSMRAFCNLELGRDPIPDETTILNFRHLLEAHECHDPELDQRFLNCSRPLASRRDSRSIARQSTLGALKVPPRQRLQQSQRSAHAARVLDALVRVQPHSPFRQIVS